MTELSVDRATFTELANGEQPVVVYVEAALNVDVDPLAAYATLADGTAHSFLLESAEKTASSDPAGAFSPGPADRRARYSYVGYDPALVATVGPEETTVDVFGDTRFESLVDAPGTDAGDVLDRLRDVRPDVDLAGFPETDRQQFTGGFVGFLGYEAVYDLWLDGIVDRPVSEIPDAEFVLSDATLAVDHVAGETTLVFTPVVRPSDDPGVVYDELQAEAERVAATLADADHPNPNGVAFTDDAAGPRDEYEAAVRRAKEHVEAGDIYQGVISRTRTYSGDVNALALYDALRDASPSPYMYLLDHGELAVVGASPETLVSVHDDTVESNPIAGTCKRGNSPVEDRRLAGELLADGKERSEHTMLVDLARNDVRRVSEPGSVSVDEFMTVRKYSHVQHIESTVTGSLASEMDAYDATRASFPAGTLTGAPKVRAMEIVDDLERKPRGVYGGGVGYYSWTGDADIAIVIRTATVQREDASESGTAPGTVTVQAGAGIVADSDPAAEYDETERKMDGVLEALDRLECPPEVSR